MLLCPPVARHARVVYGFTIVFPILRGFSVHCIVSVPPTHSYNSRLTLLRSFDGKPRSPPRGQYQLSSYKRECVWVGIVRYTSFRILHPLPTAPQTPKNLTYVRRFDSQLHGRANGIKPATIIIKNDSHNCGRDGFFGTYCCVVAFDQLGKLAFFWPWVPCLHIVGTCL